MVRTPLGEVRVDETGKVAGRGAYVCRNEECVEQALKQKRLARSLGVPVDGEAATELRGRLGGHGSAE